MKDLDPLIFIAVFQEMMGPLLWVLILASLAATAAFVMLLVRENGIVSKRLVQAEVAGVFGGGLALVLMAKVSSSGFTDAGGPADWFLIGLVYGAGLIGTIILYYAIAGWTASAIQRGT